MGKFNISAASALLAVIVLAAALLRLGGIGAQSFWHDEALTVVSAKAPFAQIIDTVRHSENCPPVYFILINLWSKVFGLSDASLRMPSALLGVATVVLIYQLGKELFDRVVALTAAALLAVAPFHIAYSQEARPYALLMLLLVLCVWAFVRLMQSGSPRAQVAYVLLAAAALYTHTFAVFTIATLNLFYFVAWVCNPCLNVKHGLKTRATVDLRRWMIMQAAVIVLFGPWIPATREVAQMGLPWMRRPTAFDEAMVEYAGGAWPLAMLTILLIFGLYRGWRERNDWVWMLLALVVIPVVAPILYGIFTPRYGIVALIGLTILPAYGAVRLGRAACVAVVILASVSSFTSATTKPDIRAAAGHLIEHGHAEDVRINRFDLFSERVLDYYLAGRGPRRVDEWPAQPPPRVWMLTSDQAAPPTYEIVSRHAFTGVILLELRPKSPATTPATEPVAVGQRPE